MTHKTWNTGKTHAHTHTYIYILKIVTQVAKHMKQRNGRISTHKPVMTEETDRNSIEGRERVRIFPKQEGYCKSQAKTMRMEEHARNIGPETTEKNS